MSHPNGPPAGGRSSLYIANAVAKIAGHFGKSQRCECEMEDSFADCKRPKGTEEESREQVNSTL